MKTIILTDEQHAALQAALDYATEQRFYEASQTTDDLDRVEIEAGAHEWAKLQDLLQASVASANDIQVKVFLWRGVTDIVLANTTALGDVEIIHADNGCEGLSDEDAAEAYKEKLKSEGFTEFPYSDGCYEAEDEPEDEDDE